MSNKKLVSVVISVYNEEEVLENFYKSTLDVLENLSWDYELIFVNDGSIDKSEVILDKLSYDNKKVKIINFSRNFGHEAAMIAGIDHATGDGVICMDADLQHPPESIPDILNKFDEGFEIISMVRRTRADGGFFKKITSNMFYGFLNLLSPIKFEKNASDFIAISKKVANILKSNYRESVRYLRGFVQSVGFKRATLQYTAQPRSAGKSKYGIKKLISFSLATICSFSNVPLKLGVYSGVCVAFWGLVLMIYTIVQKVTNGAPSGYSTVIVAMCFMFAILLCIIGIIGQYISVLFIEIKNRPIYIVDNTKNFGETNKKEL